VGLFQGCKAGSIFKNQTVEPTNILKRINHIFISNDTEKALENFSDSWFVSLFNPWKTQE
jgi:hypothetical protein